MKKWKLWMAILLIFIAGVSIGIAGTGLYIRHIALSVFQGGQPAVARFITKRLASRLDLSDAQQTEVFKSVSETQRRLLELRRRQQPENEEIISNGIARIKTVLSPQQQEKIDKLYSRFKQRWRVKDNLSEQHN